MFKIEITEVTEVVRQNAKEYQKVSDSGNPMGGGPVYDYVAGAEKREKITRQVLTQEVETLDMPAVIKAVNRL